MKGMYNFLYTHDLPKLNQKDKNNIIRMVTSHVIEAGRNNVPKEES
jgi:hypothetical protein